MEPIQVLLKDNRGSILFPEDSKSLPAQARKIEMKEKPPKISSEMDFIILNSVEKGCKKEMSLLIKLIKLGEFEGDVFRKLVCWKENTKK